MKLVARRARRVGGVIGLERRKMATESSAKGCVRAVSELRRERVARTQGVDFVYWDEWLCSAMRSKMRRYLFVISIYKIIKLHKDF